MDYAKALRNISAERVLHHSTRWNFAIRHCKFLNHLQKFATHCRCQKSLRLACNTASIFFAMPLRRKSSVKIIPCNISLLYTQYNVMHVHCLSMRRILEQFSRIESLIMRSLCQDTIVSNVANVAFGMPNALKTMHNKSK